jgi:type VI secretion system secreted protein Hcp
MKMIRSTALFCAALLSFSALASPAHADDAYLRVTGAKGELKGSVTQKGREGWMNVVSVRHELKSPRDPASGQATGRRQHGLLVVTKPLDKASVRLRHAWVTNEALKEVTLQLVQPSPKGGELVVLSVTLKNAAVANLELSLSANGPALENVSFAYQEITWKSPDNGDTAADQWLVTN